MSSGSCSLQSRINSISASFEEPVSCSPSKRSRSEMFKASTICLSDSMEELVVPRSTFPMKSGENPLRSANRNCVKP